MMVVNKKLTQQQRESLLQRNNQAVEMVLLYLDGDLVDRLKKQYGTTWKTEAAAILKTASLDL
jgi:hypothetical protein